MRFLVENLGPINNANLELGDLTMICGKNNNGKTYLSYTLDSFLDTIDSNLSVPLSAADMNTLLTVGELDIDLNSVGTAFFVSLNVNAEASTVDGQSECNCRQVKCN